MKTEHKSKRTFPVSVFGDIYKANAEASRYARTFMVQAGLGHSYDQPRLFVTYEKDIDAYHIEPNWNFMPLNPAWKLLCEEEAEGNA